jgi:NAD(P)-dependent dehydrogenase (short-subunit alcohol dehydrogenase family)
MTELAGRLAVVTGAGSGIGRALAEQLVDAGADVALCDIDGTTLAETVERCRSRRPAAVVSAMVVDVSDRARLDEFAAAVAEVHATDSLGLLFNNAGVGGGESLLANDEAEWDRTFDITWGGTYRTTRAFLPMLVASASADIVNISSINGVCAELQARSPASAYATAKFAVKGFTEAMQTDFQVYAPHVRATLVIPGSIRTSISVNSLAMHGRDPLTLTSEQLTAERRRLVARGIDVNGLDDEALRRQLDEWKGGLAQTGLLTPEQAATMILDGVRAGRWRIVVGVDAVAMDRVVRRFPTRVYGWSNARLELHSLLAAPIGVGGALVRYLGGRVRGKLARR